MIFIWYSNRHGAVNEVRSIFPVPLLPASHMQLARPALFPGFFLCTFSLYFFSQILLCSLYFFHCTFYSGAIGTRIFFSSTIGTCIFFSQVPLVHDFPPLKYHWYKHFFTLQRKKTENSTAKMRDKMKNSTRHSYMYFYYGESV